MVFLLFIAIQFHSTDVAFGTYKMHRHIISMICRVFYMDLHKSMVLDTQTDVYNSEQTAKKSSHTELMQIDPRRVCI